MYPILIVHKLMRRPGNHVVKVKNHHGNAADRAEQKVVLPPIKDSLSLHETGFDSLGFAILVARLEDDLGIDPFTVSNDAAFPLTIGDFIEAYEHVPA